MVRITILLLLISAIAEAQQRNPNPLVWTSETKKLENGVYEIIFKGSIHEGWEMYSQTPGPGGPTTTSSIEFESTNQTPLGIATESGGKTAPLDPIFNTNTIRFKDSIILEQKLTLKDPKKPVSGYLTYVFGNGARMYPLRKMFFEFTFE